MLQIPELSAVIAKSAILLLPVIGLGIAFLIRPPRYFQWVGMLLGTLWCIPYLLLLNILAETLGWWSYAESENAFYNMPIEILLGWAVLWGAFLPFAFDRLNILFPISIALLLDLIAMPKLTSLFTLGEMWLVGEAAMIVGALLPSLIIYRITVNRNALGWRAFMQSIIWGGWIVFLIPAILLTYEGKDIFSILQLDGWHYTLFFNAMTFAAFIGYAALHEFAKAGEGTPIPFDPPIYLVTTGPYAYIANPLQLSTLLMLLVLAVAFHSPLILASIASFIIFTELFVRWHHLIDIENRLGEDWLTYKKYVRNWLPRWKPYIHQTSTVYFSRECNICKDTENWMKHLKPTGIEFTDAALHPTKDLDRVTYRHYSDRFEESGTTAIARIFEQVNLSFAMLGWLMRLPIIRTITQIIIDGVGERGEQVIRKKLLPEEDKTTHQPESPPNAPLCCQKDP